MATTRDIGITESSSLGRGLAFAIGAYAVWGLFPLYFAALLPSNPFEVVVYRVIFSLLFCLLLITVTRSWHRVRAVARQPRVVWLLGLAGILIFINWEVFILAVDANLVVETSLGYFISPLVSVALGVLYFRERLRRLQWVAVGLGSVAVVVMAFGISLLTLAIPIVLAVSFGFYGLVKKKVGGSVGAMEGFAFETAWVLPIALVQFAIVGQVAGIGLFDLGPWHAALLMFSGVLTAVPLLLFAAGARRLPLSVIGLIQFFTPVSTFLLGIFFFRQVMPPLEWIGFVLVWCALVLLTTDMLRHSRARRGERRRAPGNSVDEVPEPLPE
jgi:chloramphenicol-sensitive protein RarD